LADLAERELNEIKTTILLAEDHEITRIGLKILLEQIPGMSVIAEAGDGNTAVAKTSQLNPDIVLMDIGMPGMDGIEATRVIKEKIPATKVLVVTSHEEESTVFASFSAGADGYCSKDAPKERLAVAIQTVLDGRIWMDPRIASLVLTTFRRVSSAPQYDSGGHVPATREPVLSERELDVLRLVVDGMSNQEISEKLSISPETVKTHMKHILDKLSVSDRTQAAVKALREGLL
jgi:two-component system, NarL family, response regulator LiaR